MIDTAQIVIDPPVARMSNIMKMMSVQLCSVVSKTVVRRVSLRGGR